MVKKFRLDLWLYLNVQLEIFSTNQTFVDQSIHFEFHLKWGME